VVVAEMSAFTDADVNIAANKTGMTSFMSLS
jgi:hypothetical protein